LGSCHLIDRGVGVGLPIAWQISGRGRKKGRDHKKIRKIADQVWTRYKRDLKIKNCQQFGFNK